MKLDKNIQWTQKHEIKKKIQNKNKNVNKKNSKYAKSK